MAVSGADITKSRDHFGAMVDDPVWKSRKVLAAARSDIRERDSQLRSFLL
jgi:hypothetical protein